MTTSHQQPPAPTAAEVEDMTLEQRARLAGELDDVDVVNDEGYLVARGDFAEPVGPAFWERRYNP
jgi:ubiquinol-cytochrome c reductase iron-sulfur subunit